MDDINFLLTHQLLPFMPSTYDRVLRDSMNENNRSPYKHVISDEGKKLLKTIPFSESKKLNDTCPIFQISFDNEEDVTELPCGHVFVPEAIEKWLNEEQPVCPVCRYKMPSKEKLFNRQPELTSELRRRRPIPRATDLDNSDISYDPGRYISPHQTLNSAIRRPIYLPPISSSSRFNTTENIRVNRIQPPVPIPDAITEPPRRIPPPVAPRNRNRILPDTPFPRINSSITPERFRMIRSRFELAEEQEDMVNTIRRLRR